MDIDIKMLECDTTNLDLDVVNGIKDSIQAHQLLHPLTVVPKDGRYIVKAGRKRFLALKELGVAEVPCLVLDADLTDNQIKEITIDENLKRVNLEWWDKCIQEAELHKLRQSQHGIGRQKVKSGWSLRDTAKELGMGFGTLSQDIRLAEAVMANPSLKKITDKKTAMRLVFNEAKRIDAETVAGLGVDIDTNVIYNGEASEILKYIPANTFDCVFTDPPWLEYKDSRLTKDDKTILVFRELYRVMKYDSFLYAIVSTQDFFTYQTELAQIGFKVQQMPLIWHKKNVISHGLRSWEYHRDYEPILLAVKGSPVLVDSGLVSAVYSSPAVHPTKLIHPNEKPVDVPIHFLEQSTYEGSLVLDPFGGSGVTAEACLKLRRRYVLIEREPVFYKRIEQRLNSLDKLKGEAST